MDQALITHFTKLFVGNPSAYGEKRERSWNAVKEPITPALIDQHLNSNRTIGSYCGFIETNIAYCRWLCFDIDFHTTPTSHQIEQEEGKEALELYLKSSEYMKEVKEIMDQQRESVESFTKVFISSGIPEESQFLEESTRGWHIWVFIEKTTLSKAYFLRSHLLKILQTKSNFEIEGFPKQNRLSKLGNCVKLPKLNQIQSIILKLKSFNCEDLYKKLSLGHPNGSKPTESLQCKIQESSISKNNSPMRKAFQDIWEGKFIIEHSTQSNTGVVEMEYWKAFWREFLNCGGSIEEGIKHFRETSNQPEFDEKKTRDQLNQPCHQTDLQKRPSLMWYQKLFPNNIEEVVPESLNMEQTYMIERNRNECCEFDPYSGIYQIKLHFKNNRLINIDKKLCWKWKELRITQVLLPEDNSIEHRYNGYYNTHEFKNQSTKQLIDLISADSCLENPRLFGPLLREYTQKAKIPEHECSKTAGFTLHDWKLPHNTYIAFESGIGAKIRECLIKMATFPDSDKEYTPERAKQHFIDLYHATNVVDKDIVFTWGFIAPFLYALRNLTNLIPILALSGRPHTGKSSIGKIITKKFWNNPEQDFLSKDIMASQSRAQDYLSSSTLPLLIDDCGEMSSDLKADIKTYTTGESFFERKNKDQTTKVSKPLCASLIFAFNDLPELFNDSGFIDRVIHLKVDEEIITQQDSLFTEIYNSIPNGEIGYFIYNHTKDWTFEQLKERYKNIPDIPNISSPRQNTIIKLLTLGKNIAKELFDIDLSLISLRNRLDETKMLGNDEIFDELQEQLIEGLESNIENSFNDTNSSHPKLQWIHTSIMETYHQGVKGYAYTHSNLIDLQKHLEIKKLSMEKFAQILRMRWSEVEHKRICINRKTTHVIFIPKKYLEALDGTLDSFSEPPWELHEPIKKEVHFR